MIGLISTSGNSQNSGSTTLSWSHIIGSEKNRLLVVGVHDLSSGVTGATFNGVAMTLISSQSTPSSGGKTYLFYLLNPPTGTFTVTVNITIFGGTQICGVSGSYTGVSQITQPDNFGTAIASTAVDCPTTVNVINSNCWLIGAAAGYSTSGIAAMDVNSGGVSRVFNSSNEIGLELYDSNAIVGTGSQTVDPNITLSSGNRYMSSVLASFIGAPASPSPSISPSSSKSPSSSLSPSSSSSSSQSPSASRSPSASTSPSPSISPSSSPSPSPSTSIATNFMFSD